MTKAGAPAPAPGRRAVHILVHGRVQGVGYRAFVAAEAEARGLEGHVRNRRDGTVEAVFAGAPDAVAAMLEACAHGPRHARVERLEVVGEGVAAPSGFCVLADG